MKRIYSPISCIGASNKTWLNRSAKWLRIKGITSNHLSFVGLLFSFISGFDFYIAFQCVSFWLRGILLLTASLFIQGRLICNVLNQLVDGDSIFITSYNSILSLVCEPISNCIIFIGVSLGLTQMPSAVTLGWLVVLLSVFTAFSRILYAVLYFKVIKKETKQYSMIYLCGCSMVAAFLPQYASQLLLYGYLFSMIVVLTFLGYLYVIKIR